MNDRTVSSGSHGFTLPEVLITVVTIGILGAMASPSLLSWYNRIRVEAALDSIQGALQEAQRQALRTSRNNCTVTIPLTANPTLNSNCFVSGERRLNQVSLSNDSPTPPAIATVSFDFKGRTTSNLTLLISATDAATNVQSRCLVVSDGLGLVRTGVFDGASCTTQR